MADGCCPPVTGVWPASSQQVAADGNRDPLAGSEAGGAQLVSLCC